MIQLYLTLLWWVNCATTSHQPAELSLLYNQLIKRLDSTQSISGTMIYWSGLKKLKFDSLFSFSINVCYSLKPAYGIILLSLLYPPQTNISYSIWKSSCPS